MTCTRATFRLIKLALLWFVFPCLMGMAVEPALAATYTVNSLDDTNDGLCGPVHCSLREAIQAANGSREADIILFNRGGTITLGSDLPGILHVGGALTIDGTGQSITVSGAGLHRPFYIEALADLTLIKLVIRNCYDSYGGAIYNGGTLTLRDCLLSDNRALWYGGGIYNAGTLTLAGTDLSSNTVDSYSGGGLYIDDGVVNITGGVFTGNTATCSGGAIYNNYTGEYQKGRLYVEGASFFFNSAGGCSGGAIYSDSDLQIRRSNFSLNTAEDNGGAIYIDTVDSASIYTSTFFYNIATFGSGGAVYFGNADSNTSSASDCTFKQNQAGTRGGAFYVLRGLTYFFRSLLDRNETAGDGGGGYNSFGNLIVINCTLYDNRAQKGGGLYYAETSSGRIQNSTFSANRASVADGGGALYGNFSVNVHNSIIAQSVSGGNCGNASSKPTNFYNNIEDGTSCAWDSHNGSRSSTNPLLGPLADNGGLTKTMALLPGSPALNGVVYNPPNGCPDEDQRRYPRPFLACDIGAVEQYSRLMLPMVIRN